MKNKINIIITACCLLVFACEQKPLMRFGFDAEFKTKSSGLCIMDVDHHASSIWLEGSVQVDEGSVLVELCNPDGECIFSQIYDSSESIQICEYFDAERGYWKLKYKSFDGKGSINVNLRMLKF